MATFAELQTRVRRRVIDAPASVVAEVPTLVREAYAKAQKLRNFQVMKKETLLTTTVDVRVGGAMPADFKEYRGSPYRTQFYGSPIWMTVLHSRIQATAMVGLDASGGPSFLLESDATDAGARNWEVWPLSDGASDYDDGEYRIVVPYWRYFPALSADADENWFTVYGEEWIVAKATAAAFELDWDMENATMWEQIAKAELRDFYQADTSLIMSTTPTLVPHSGAE